MPLSSPLFAGLLSLGPCVNVKGWRLLFVVGGIIPIIYAVFVYFRLPASFDEASFLEPEEKAWIEARQGGRRNEPDLPFWEATKSVVSNGAWRLCTACCVIAFGMTSVLMFWATLLIQDMLYGEDDEDNDTCGSKHGSAALAIVLTAIPFLVSGMLCLWTRRFEVRHRPRASAVAYTIGGLLMISWIGAQYVVAVVRFLLLTGAVSAGYVSFCYATAMAITSCEASTHAVATSLYNSVATIGAIVLPMIFGKLMDVLGSDITISLFGGFFLIATLLILRVDDPLMKEDVDGAEEGASYSQAPSSSS